MAGEFAEFGLPVAAELWLQTESGNGEYWAPLDVFSAIEGVDGVVGPTAEFM